MTPTISTPRPVGPVVISRGEYRASKKVASGKHAARPQPLFRFSHLSGKLYQTLCAARPQLIRVPSIPVRWTSRISFLIPYVVARSGVDSLTELTQHRLNTATPWLLMSPQLVREMNLMFHLLTS